MLRGDFLSDGDGNFRGLHEDLLVDTASDFDARNGGVLLRDIEAYLDMGAFAFGLV